MAERMGIDMGQAVAGGEIFEPAGYAVGTHVVAVVLGEDVAGMPDPMNYPVEQLRLTEGAAKAILSRRVHVDMLNRLLENIQFGQLTYTMYYATEPNQTAGIMSRNNLLSYTGSLYAEAMINTVQQKQQIMGLNYKLGSELINPNT